MGKKRNIYIIPGLSLLISALSFSICYSPLEYICYPSQFEGIMLGIFFFASAIFVFSIILIFFRDEVFRSWFRFTKYFIPIALVLILISPNSSGGFLVGFGGPDKEETTYWMTLIFSLVSIILITVKYFRRKRTV